MVKMREKLQFPKKGVLMLPSLGGQVAVRCFKSCRALGWCGGQSREGGRKGRLGEGKALGVERVRREEGI